MRRSVARLIQWKAGVSQLPSRAFQVTLDGKPLKTPGGAKLEVPETKPWLANMIAQEWAVMQSPKQLKSHMVPLTSLAGRAIDMKPDERDEVIEKLLPYLDTDTLVVLSPERDCEGTLRKAQLERFPAMIDDACSVWNIDSGEGLSVLDTESSLYGNYQSDAVKQKVRDWMKSLDPYQFAALERATTAARSLIIGMNTVLHRRPVEELADLATLDVTHQTAVWGEVEDTHDVDHEDIRRLIGASYIATL